MKCWVIHLEVLQAVCQSISSKKDPGSLKAVIHECLLESLETDVYIQHTARDLGAGASDQKTLDSQIGQLGIVSGWTYIK